jgi:hypothetical protein
MHCEPAMHAEMSMLPLEVDETVQMSEKNFLPGFHLRYTVKPRQFFRHGCIAR